MSSLPIALGIAGGVAAVGTAAAFIGATTLFNRIIPRQDELRVDLNEMCDMSKWEEYKKIIHPKREWLMEHPMENVSIKARDGITLQGYFFSAEKESDTVAIALHGYTSDGLSNCSSIGSFFVKEGYDCLLVDSRGHGKSEGDYIGFGILDRFDCLSWINYINERFGGKKKIILYGISMGAATVLMTAGFPQIPENVSAVISDCAFTTPYEVFAHILKRDYKMLPFPVMNINNAMCRRKAGYGFKDYSTITAVENTKCPVLFFHGSDDNFVPVWMTEKNYEHCNSPKDVLYIKNAGHGASYFENTQAYEEKMREFLAKNL